MSFPLSHIFKHLTLSALLAWLGLAVFCCQHSYAVEDYQPITNEHALQVHSWAVMESIPSDIVGTIEVDRNNHLWLGASNAVLYFDGKSITTYSEDDGLPATGNSIYAVEESEDGSLYAFAQQQIYRLDGQTWREFGPEIQPSPNIYWLNRQFFSWKQNLWLAVDNHLLKVNKSTYQYLPFNDGEIESFIIDKHGYFWVLFQASKSVKRYTYSNDVFVELNHWPAVLSSSQVSAKALGNVSSKKSHFTLLADGSIWLISQDRDQPPISIDSNRLERLNSTNENVWREYRYPAVDGYSDQSVVKNDRGDIYIFNTTHLHVYVNGVWANTPLKTLAMSGPILHTFKSNDGAIWLLEYDKSIRRFDVNNPKQLTYNNIIYGCDSRLSQFFIHKNGSIIERSKALGHWRKHTAQDGLIDTPSGILCTQAGDIVVYGSDGEQAAISLSTRKVSANAKGGLPWAKRLLPQLGINVGSLSVLETSDNTIYFGENDEYDIDSGVLVRMRKMDEAFNFTNIDISAGRVAGIAELKNGEIALSGLALSILRNGHTTVLPLPDKLLANWIDEITSDAEKNLWVSSWYYGVLWFNGTRWKQYSINEGLRGKNTTSVLPLKNGRVLALNDGGIDWFDGTTWQATDMVGIKAIREGSKLAEDDDGGIWVNQYSRDWSFRKNNPSEQVFKTVRYTASPYAPYVSIRLDEPLKKYQTTATVLWRANDTWFETPSKQLKFSYRLNSGEWSAYSSDTSHHFSNLSAQTYLVEVRARDGDGNVSPIPASLSFRIQVPFWQATWFYISITLFVLVLIAFIFILLAQRLKQTSRINEARMQFLTHISHELRNPLALIILPLEEHLLSKSPSSNTGLGVALKNAKRLKQLIDQLLEYRLLKNRSISLDAKQGDIVAVLKMLIEDLSFLAAKKNQTIILQTSLHNYVCIFDHEVFRKIMDNLISNSVKYSYEYSLITVTVNRVGHGGGLSISVMDEGVGVSAKDQRRIFDPFFIRGERRFGNSTSFGIGLAMVKDLVELCQGDISLQSPPPQKDSGAVFTLNFAQFIEVPREPGTVLPSTVECSPIDKAVNTYDAKPADEELESKAGGEPNIHGLEFKSGLAEPLNKVQLLIVDDNVELAHYLQSELSNEFDCRIEFDGAAGLSHALKAIPDVIISDYMMPHIDGLELCQSLKNHPETSHIPVLLHTAMISEQHQLKGFAFGAVDYLTKPVSLSVLRARIRNLIQDRSRYATYLQSTLAKIEPSPSDALPAGAKVGEEMMSISEQDERFLSKVKSTLLSHYHDAEFNAEKQASLMHMSRSAFYRKFKALTNITPAEHIKVYRLNASRTLLEQGLNVSEVLHRVGYSDPSSFNRAYKRYFGSNPSEQKCSR